ncbi:MAG: hypothetical protein H7336_13485 [Bacteriovorax sp.]|nr:hypothetical protein [Bacteriovorax sp.]
MKLSTEWLNKVLSKSPDEAWVDIFAHLKGLVPKEAQEAKTSYRKLEDDVAYIDHVLSASAWDLWRDFSSAPRASTYVQNFWKNTVGPKAVLILDSLSIREINPICTEISKLGLKIKNIELAGSEIPSETDIYASAIGLSGRASLAKGSNPKGFLISTENTFVDSFKNTPFKETNQKITSEKNIFIWHGWPDDSLHVYGKHDDAFSEFIEHVTDIITSEGFGSCIQKLAQGRELLITSDHGYCNTSSFTSAVGEHHQELKLLGHTRAKKSADLVKGAGKTIPPATMEMMSTSTNELYRIAVGRRRPSDKGFPALTHGGLSLMECAVPLIHIVGGASNG